MDFTSVDVPECAGLLSISRVSGQVALFDSPFAHQGYVSLRIYKAKGYRALSETQYTQDKKYIEVWMSYSQFAEAITTMNIGSGVPCSIRYSEGKEFDELELTNERFNIDEEITSAAKESLEHLYELIDAIKEEKMSKKTSLRLINLAKKSARKLDDSLPFIAKQYLEYLDSLEQKAKTEIAAYADMALKEHQDLKLLTNEE